MVLHIKYLLSYLCLLVVDIERLLEQKINSEVGIVTLREIDVLKAEETKPNKSTTYTIKIN